MKHVSGNLASRFTDFLTTDGEKPDRDRDSEFIVESDDAVSVRGVWDRGWSVLDATLGAMTPSDLLRTVTIRGEPNTATLAKLLKQAGYAAGGFGKWGLGVYLGKAAPGSAYGAAGSLVILLIWVYWSAQILFLGAEFTHVYARRVGSRRPLYRGASPLAADILPGSTG